MFRMQVFEDANEILFAESCTSKCFYFMQSMAHIAVFYQYFEALWLLCCVWKIALWTTVLQQNRASVQELGVRNEVS